MGACGAAFGTGDCRIDAVGYGSILIRSPHDGRDVCSNPGRSGFLLCIRDKGIHCCQQVLCYDEHGYIPTVSEYTTSLEGTLGPLPFLVLGTVYRATDGQSTRTVFGQFD